MNIFASSSSTGGGSKKKSKPIPKHVKEQEKGLTEERDTTKRTESGRLRAPTKAEIKQLNRIWKHYEKNDPRWPLERDRFKARSESAGYLLATYLISYYMQLNIVRDRAARVESEMPDDVDRLYVRKRCPKDRPIAFFACRADETRLAVSG